MSTESSHELLPDRPPNEHLLAYVLGASLVVLLVTPLAIPPVLAAEGATSIAAAVLHVLGATVVGYLVGLLLLLRSMDGRS